MVLFTRTSPFPSRPHPVWLHRWMCRYGWLSCAFSCLKVHTPLPYAISGFWRPFDELTLGVDGNGKLRDVTFRLSAAVHWEHNHHLSDDNRPFSGHPWKKWTRTSYDSNTSSSPSGNTEADQLSVGDNFPPVHLETGAYTVCTHLSWDTRVQGSIVSENELPSHSFPSLCNVY